uniref:Rep protein n=1 Tax=Cressdnaviricota sp. TaxID=2748378 RepID=A0A345MQF5_9VIRU
MMWRNKGIKEGGFSLKIVKTFFLSCLLMCDPCCPICPPKTPPPGLLPEDREYFGYALCPLKKCLICHVYGSENCPPLLCGSVAKRKLEALADICIGNSAVPSPRKLLWPPSADSLEEVSMPSCQDLNLPPYTAQRKSPESKDLGNGDVNPFVETPKRIGSRFGMHASPGIWMQYPHPYEWYLTAPFEQLLVTSRRVRVWFGKSSSSGGLQELVNRAEPGMKAEWTLILKIPEASSGMVMETNRMLSWMNFEV